MKNTYFEKNFVVWYDAKEEVEKISDIKCYNQFVNKEALTILIEWKDANYKRHTIYIESSMFENLTNDTNMIEYISTILDYLNKNLEDAIDDYYESDF